MFNCQDIQLLAAGLPVKDSVGLNPVGPDLIFLKFPLERFAFEGWSARWRMASLIVSRVPASKEATSLIACGVSPACLTAVRRTRP